MNEENEQFHNACAVWEITIGAGDPPLTVSDIHNGFRGYCKKYVFQLERGDKHTELNPEGYLHYQCRVSLIKKRRPNEVAKYFRETCGWNKIHVSPTVTTNLYKEAFYCMKNDTRVEGPFKDTDYEVEVKPTRQLLESGILEKRRPWQEKIADISKVFDMRSIHMIICKVGGEGKSLFSEYIEYAKLGFEVPAMTTMEDIMQCCMGVKPHRVYFIDMPRAMSKNRLAGFFAGIESLKNGVMYDKRYCFKKRRIDRPNIFVFSNKVPNLNYLSKDRWKLWTIRNQELVAWGDYQAARESNGRVQEQKEEAFTKGSEDEEADSEEAGSSHSEGDSEGSE